MMVMTMVLLMVLAAMLRVMEAMRWLPLPFTPAHLAGSR
jgi:hypothetical protein